MMERGLGKRNKWACGQGWLVKDNSKSQAWLAGVAARCVLELVNHL